MDVTVDAVRARIKRETISHVREGGRVYVILDTDQDYASRDQDHGQYTGQGSAQPETGPDYRDELVEALRDQVAFLRRELEAERNAHAEARRIAYALAQRPQLEAPPETRDARETASEDIGGAAPPAGDTGEPRGRSSWWRRFFGFE
jgi:hypothetical protein